MMKYQHFPKFSILSLMLVFSSIFLIVDNVFAQGPECPLTIIKSATPADDTEFDFELGGNAVDPNFTLQDPSDNSITISVVSNIPGVLVNEILPPGWSLASVQCEGDPGFEFNTSGLVADLLATCTANGSIPEGQCTFVNVQGTNVPTFSQLGFIGLAALLGVAGLIAYRRKLIAQ